MEKLEKYEEATDKYRNAVQYKPDHASAWYNWGTVLFAFLGKYEEATGKYREAVRYKPDHARAWYNWGMTLRMLGRHQEANQKIMKAEKLGLNLP